MVFPFPADARTGPYYNTALAILWPTMMAGTRRQWLGREHLGRPGDGMVIAANHISWIDPILIAHFMNDTGRPPRFLAKDALFEAPVLGSIMSGADQIPVHRGSADAAQAVASAVEAVEAGEAVFVYPEGTLSRDPQMWPMSGKTGAARIALTADAPVIPLAHWGGHRIMRPYKKELRMFPPKPVAVIAGGPVDLADLRALDLTVPVLEEATTRIMDAITELEAELRNETPPPDRWDYRAERRVPVVRGLAAHEEMSRRASEEGPGASSESQS